MEERRGLRSEGEVSFQVEPSTVGDGRLLRFLLEQQPPAPSWEAPPSRPVAPCCGGKGSGVDGIDVGTNGDETGDAETRKRKEETLESWLEASVEDASLRIPLDLLQQAGAFLLAMDRLHQSHQLTTNLTLRNASAWEAAVSARDRAAQQLALGGVLLDFLLGSLHATPGVRHLRLLPAREPPSLVEVQRQLLIGLQQRAEAARALRQAAQVARLQIVGTEGVLAASQWRRIILLLMEYGWPVLKKLYQRLEFELGDGNYPYRSEVYVQLLQIPYGCWEAQADVRSRLPLPQPAPFQEHFALLRVSPDMPCAERDRDSREKQPDADASPLKLRLEFPPSTGALVQRRFSLHCTIKLRLPLPGAEHRTLAVSEGLCLCCALRKSPSALCARAKQQSSFLKCEDRSRQHQTSTSSFDKKGELLDLSCQQNLGKRRGETEAELTASEVNCILEKAQWVFLDLAVFHVLASQLLNFESQNGVLLARRHLTEGKVGIKKKGLCSVRCGSLCMAVEFLSLDSDSASLLIRNVPFKGKAKSDLGDASLHVHDLVLTLKFQPSRPTTHSEDLQQSDDEREEDSTVSQGPSCCVCSLRVLRQFQKVCVLAVRQLFLETWYNEAFQRPEHMGDMAYVRTQPIFALQKRQQRRLNLNVQTRKARDTLRQTCDLRGRDLLSHFCQWLLEGVETLFTDAAMQDRARQSNAVAQRETAISDSSEKAKLAAPKTDM